MELDTIKCVELLIKNGFCDRALELESSLELLGLDYVIKNDRIELAAPVELLQKDQILAGISPGTCALISRLDLFWEIDSTNTYILKNTGDPDFHGSLCTAEQQTAGKGRRGRQWVSPFAKNIYISIGWTISKKNMAEGLSLYLGMSLVDCLRGAGMKDVGMKWPNDLMIGDGKLAGILIELDLKRDVAHLVIGIGVNLALDRDNRRAIGRPVSTVSDQLSLGRNELCSLIAERTLQALSAFERHGLADKLSDWSAYDCYAGQEVEVQLGETLIIGINRGVDETGALLVETGGEIRKFSSGEVSLRKSPGNR